MKIKCEAEKESYCQRYIRKKEEKVEKLKNWHRFFAWYPVRINDHECAWLEMVERKYEQVYLLEWINSHGDRTGNWYIDKSNPIYRQIPK